MGEAYCEYVDGIEHAIYWIRRTLFYEKLNISWLDEWLLASRKELWSMEVDVLQKLKCAVNSEWSK
jgi:hypothetical protein